MQIHSKVYLPVGRHRACIFSLLLFWCAGLLLGVYSGTAAEDVSLALMRAAAGSRVSIVNLLAVTVLPFLLSAFAVFFSRQWLIFPLCFGKAFSFGFCAYAVCGAFPGAGWLIRFLLLFSDQCFIPVLFWFWIRHIGGQKRNLRWDTAVCLGVAAVVGSLDQWLISPFLAALIEL